ncbi:helix-turn-helix domain-containing protein [Puia dinghuensis]|nr:helix-turn-helix domain-containing protein [Puia dinghuensis]
MPPFRRGFYYLGLLTDVSSTKISYDNIHVNDLNSLIVFQSPGLISSFYRNRSHGYLIYFKDQCFSYYKPSIDKEFPFFNSQQTDFYRISDTQYKEMVPQFEEVFSAYEQSKDHKVASLKLLALLHQLTAFSLFSTLQQERLATPQQVLLKKYLSLVNTHYLEKRRVEDYAAMLFVTPNHLSQSIKSVAGRNALSYINERISAEAKSLISYTDLSIAEIAYKLDFSDPANFGKFFKKNAVITPLEFRGRR